MKVSLVVTSLLRRADEIIIEAERHAGPDFLEKLQRRNVYDASGPSYLCPECWINVGVESDLYGIPSKTSDEDMLKCQRGHVVPVYAMRHWRP